MASVIDTDNTDFMENIENLTKIIKFLSLSHSTPDLVLYYILGGNLSPYDETTARSLSFC